jgi:hypothetical protein
MTEEVEIEAAKVKGSRVALISLNTQEDTRKLLKLLGTTHSLVATTTLLLVNTIMEVHHHSLLMAERQHKATIKDMVDTKCWAGQSRYALFHHRIKAPKVRTCAKTVFLFLSLGY